MHFSLPLLLALVASSNAFNTPLSAPKSHSSQSRCRSSSSLASRHLPPFLAAAATFSLASVGFPKVVEAVGQQQAATAVNVNSGGVTIMKDVIKKSAAISPTAGSVALKKSSGIPVFMVCTRWGSPFMVYGPTGRPTALYFLSPSDAHTMSQEFLQLPSMSSGRQSIHVMSTNMERALRQATAEDVPTGGIGEGDGKVETMEYKLSAQEKNVKKSQKLAAEQKDPSIPIFTVEGLTSKKGESLLFFSLDDLNSAWSSQKLPGSPNVEVFDFVDVLKSMEESPEAFKTVKFVSSSEAVEYKQSITKKGNNQAKLPRMR
ncbi:hypothetical protein TL16_g04117 [Triparma laevis f. inornata]|uniref:Uncharacterized protein n=1 Tax=Triparma laevis f. inornata TaxID=1714386 RepID=A0A9W7AB22_9STRA|nr:hypothetical protein TL16_g04117 [Triparma laevis f. inornata]